MFDYKLIMMLGLSIVVYFLYREIEHLNKRVAELEKSNINDINDINAKPLKKDTDKTINQINNSIEDMENNTNTIEEYSNELEKIYSHDKMDSNTNEHDSLMVESLINMINVDNQNDDIEHKLTEHNSEEEKEHHHSPSPSQSHHSPSQSLHSPSQSQQSPKSPQVCTPNKECEQKHESDLEHETELENEAELEQNSVKKYTLEELSKLKLDELQNIASEKGISLVNDAGKRKKKADLAQEIFNQNN